MSLGIGLGIGDYIDSGEVNLGLLLCNIPDANFRSALEISASTTPNGSITSSSWRNINGTPNTNGEYILLADVTNITQVTLQYQNIADLTGIECFTALIYLNCFGNQLTSLNVSQNTALTLLFCGLNQLTSLNVSQNTALTTLQCNNNLITSLDVSQNTALINLFCNSNQLSSLDVRNGNNTNFASFYAINNANLTCISVDDAAWSTTNWTGSASFSFDYATPFSDNCFPWTLIGEIVGEAAGDQSGYSVSLSADGTTVAIGAPNNDGNSTSSGHVRVYQDVTGSWVQIGSDIDGEAAGDYSGWPVSLSDDGTIVAIGAYGNDGNTGIDRGHVRVYGFAGGAWSQIGSDIDGEAVYDGSGSSVSLSADGTIVAIGANANDGNGTSSGHVRVYQNVAGTWSQVGSDIDGEAFYDNSGRSVSLSADGAIVAIGAIYNAGNGGSSGHVRVYQNVAGSWSQIGSDIDGEAANDWSGYSVSLSDDGTIVAIGAWFNDGTASNAGHVRVYENVGGTWTQIGSDIDGEAADDRSGYSVSLSGDGSILAIGAINNDGGYFNGGHVRVYENVGGAWVQSGQDINGEANYDYSGNSVSLSGNGDRLVVGAFGNDENGNLSGKAYIYEYV